MTDCWTEGALRAHVDGALGPEEAARLTAHLGECAACADARERIAARAERIGEMLRGLEPAALPARRGWRRAAAGVVAACAAGIVLTLTAPPKAAEPAQRFVVLDDEPIETGLVVRVAIGPQQVEADVIVGPDGRARAYRLVGDSGKEGVKTE